MVKCLLYITTLSELKHDGYTTVPGVSRLSSLLSPLSPLFSIHLSSLPRLVDLLYKKDLIETVVRLNADASLRWSFF